MTKEIYVCADVSDKESERKQFVTDGLEAGFSNFILRVEDRKFTELGKINSILFDKKLPIDKEIEFVNIDSPSAQNAALNLAGKKKIVIVETKDWTVIPLENLIAKYHTTNTKLYVLAHSKEDAKLFLNTMENGADGIVLDIDSSSKLSEFKELFSSTEKVDLMPIEIKSIKPIEMGDRVCIDTCSMMSPGEGMLIGSYSNCLFLIQSESEDNGYVSSRPFRVNAGAVHSYIEVPNGKTKYISEISSGDSVLLCDKEGNTRIASVGRCKVELRPLLIVEATDEKSTYSVILQNAETIKLVTPEGSVAVNKLKVGDKVLAKISNGGRHFGMSIDETIVEK